MIIIYTSQKSIQIFQTSDFVFRKNLNIIIVQKLCRNAVCVNFCFCKRAVINFSEAAGGRVCLQHGAGSVTFLCNIERLLCTQDKIISHVLTVNIYYPAVFYFGRRSGSRQAAEAFGTNADKLIFIRKCKHLFVFIAFCVISALITQKAG